MNDDGPTITFHPSVEEYIIEPFGWEEREDGLIVDEETGEPVESFNGHEIELDELAGVVDDQEGNPVPLRDNFCDLCDYVWETREEEDS